jgi:hypothetical protein
LHWLTRRRFKANDRLDRQGGLTPRR